jgi:hypothetical protein
VTKKPFSVIIVALVGGEALARCLKRLPLGEVECVVVLRSGMDAGHWKSQSRSLIVIERPEDEPVPLRRVEGLRVASGEIVGFLEDTSWPREGWREGVRAAFVDAQAVAAGGPIELAQKLPSRCQALFWSEYGAFVPLSESESDVTPTTRVPGNNMAFRRHKLLAALKGSSEGLIEGEVCAHILAHEGQIVFSQRMGVTFSACGRREAKLSTRLHHGRIYASSRLKNRGWPARVLYLTRIPLLPFVLAVRAARVMLASGSSTGHLRVLLRMGLMVIAWSLGEALGAVRSEGRSMREWR